MNLLVKTIDGTTSRVNPNVNYGLWVTMMCQPWFTDYNKCTILEWDTDGGGELYLCGGSGTWELCTFCFTCYEPKTFFKN